MSAEKRSVSTDALETLGTIITGGGRDAIHLAVEPVFAAERLFPGQHIGFVENGVGALPLDQCLGIVDPFLPCTVFPGQQFWMVVYPRQITSLRHVWEHPAFAPEGEQPLATTDPSRRWIEEFAARIPLAYDVLMDGARDWVASHDGKWGGEYLCFGGLLEGESVPDEFWPHYESVTGQTVAAEKRGSFFTCSC